MMFKTLLCAVVAMATLGDTALKTDGEVADILKYCKYSYVEGAFSITHGMSHCASLGGHLLTVYSKKHQAAVLEGLGLSANSCVMIGLHSLTHTHGQHNWEWHSGTCVNFTNWDRYAGKPIDSHFADTFTASSGVFLRRSSAGEVRWVDGFSFFLAPIICEVCIT